MNETGEEMRDRIRRRDEKRLDELEERPRVIITTQQYPNGTRIQTFKYLTREQGLKLGRKIQAQSE